MKNPYWWIRIELAIGKPTATEAPTPSRGHSSWETFMRTFRSRIPGLDVGIASLLANSQRVWPTTPGMIHVPVHGRPDNEKVRLLAERTIRAAVTHSLQSVGQDWEWTARHILPHDMLTRYEGTLK